MTTIGNASIFNLFLACIFLFCSQANSDDKEDNLLIIGGYKRNSKTASLVEMVRMQHSKWLCNIINLKIPVSEHSSVATSIGVIHCGGKRDKEISSKCVLQTKNGQIRSFPSMVRPRSRFGLTISNDRLIAVGGRGGFHKTMETISTHGGQWVEQDLPFSVQHNCIVSIGKKVVSIGGWPGPGNYHFLNSTWILNTMNTKWTKGPSLNIDRVYHSCFYDRTSNSIYVVGGHTKQGGPFGRLLNTAEKWNLDSNIWEKIDSLPTNRGTGVYASTAVASNSRNFIGFMSGGVTGYGLDFSHIVYGLRRKDEKWIHIKDLKVGRYAHSMVNLAADEKPFTSYCALPSWE